MASIAGGLRERGSTRAMQYDCLTGQADGYVRTQIEQIEWMVRRHRLRLLLVTAVMVPAVLWVGPALVWRPPPLEGEPPLDGWERVPGVVHVHTTLSDGTGTPEDVARAARAAGASFVVITDHDTDAARAFSGYRDGVLVLAGAELSTHQGHLLGLGMRPLTFPTATDARNALDDVRHLGGTAFVAHPTSPRDDLRWSGWELEGAWGLEVLNGDSLWRRASWPALLRGVVVYAFNPAYAIAGALDRPRFAIARWDELLRRRAAAGLAGVDAHGFPSYASLFRVLRNYVLLEAPLSGEAEHDAAAVHEALTRGRSYMTVEALAPAGGFFFHAARGNERWQMGDTVAPAPGLVLRAGGNLPRGARVGVHRNGERIAVGEGGIEVEVRLPGVYRVEVHVGGWDLPWILSNPIYVYGTGETAARGRRAKRPADAPPPAAEARPLDAFEDESVLAAESDTETWVDPVVRVASERGPGNAVRFRFRLRQPRPDPSAVWGALVDRSRRNLAGDSGLVFDVRADGVYRIWVALWEERPGQPGNQVDWWQSSVRTSTGWRRHAVPFDRLYPADTNVDRELDLRRIVGLVFYIDPATGEPVREGSVWFERLGVY